VAGLVQRKQLGRVLGVVEGEAARLIDRNGARARGGVGGLAAVEAKRFHLIRFRLSARHMTRRASVSNFAKS